MHGHYAIMRLTDSRLGYFARLQTTYINTTDLCLELYFQSLSSSTKSKSVISVVTFDEEEEDTVHVSSEGLERTDWDRLFVTLPKGVHRVVVEGRRSGDGYSSLSVDDIVLQPCQQFGDFYLDFHYALLP